MQVSQTVYYLELPNYDQFIPAQKPHLMINLRQVKIACPPFNRFFYETIGAAWHWIDRKSWTPSDWQAYVAHPTLETWVAYHQGAPAGYFEIEKQNTHQVEIVQLGVMPQFERQGIGSYLLTKAVQRARKVGAKYIWLHTCSHDDPAALKMYLKHGFTLFKQEIVTKEFPDEN